MIQNLQSTSSTFVVDAEMDALNNRIDVFVQKIATALKREIGAVPRLALSGRHFDASSRAANPTVP